MSWEKSVFSYLIWLVYTVLTGTLLVLILSGAAGNTTEGVLGAVGVLAVAGGLFFLLHRFAPKYSYDTDEKHTVRNVTEAALVVVLLAIGLVFRVNGLEDAGQTEAYFEMAKVAPGQKIPQIAHGAVYFYVQFLHMVFYFLGNKFVMGICLQIFLQFAAALLFYYSMRQMAGHIAALVMFGFFMCAPFMVQNALVLSPEMFYLTCFGLVLSMLAAGSASRLHVVEFLFLGILAAFLSYMDVSGLLLLLLSAAVIFCIREEQTGWNKKGIALLLCILGFFVGFAACITGDAYFSGKKVSGVFGAWLALYQPGEFQMPVTMTVSASLWESLLPAAFLALGVFSFWRDKKSDRMSVYTIGILIVSAASVLGIFTQEMPGNVYLYLLLVILAGVSAEECLRKLPEKALEQLPLPELNAEAVEVEAEETEEPEIVELEPLPVRKPVQFIENPLPLPKKHEKRVLDYSIKEVQDAADFDVDVDDDDDFDI